MDAELRELVQAKLELEWSPEQISGWLRLTHPDRPSWQVCHETIYQALYHGATRGLSRRTDQAAAYRPAAAQAPPHAPTNGRRGSSLRRC